jgi:hypothetical protein
MITVVAQWGRHSGGKTERAVKAGEVEEREGGDAPQTARAAAERRV